MLKKADKIREKKNQILFWGKAADRTEIVSFRLSTDFGDCCRKSLFLHLLYAVELCQWNLRLTFFNDDKNRLQVWWTGTFAFSWCWGNVSDRQHKRITGMPTVIYVPLCTKGIRCQALVLYQEDTRFVNYTKFILISLRVSSWSTTTTTITTTERRFKPMFLEVGSGIILGSWEWTKAT